MTSFEALLEGFVQHTSAAFGGEVDEARVEYFKRCGEPFQDEPTYELRLRNFIEWYLLDRPLAFGLTPYEAFMAAPNQPAELKQAYLPFRDQNHSLFLIEDVQKGALALRDLWNSELVKARVDITAGYEAGAVIETRLVRLGSSVYPTATQVYHSPASAKFVVKAAKPIREARNVAEWRPFVWRVNYLQLKAERYKHVDSNAIYKEILATAQPAA